jgi:hypothetical protein
MPRSCARCVARKMLALITCVWWNQRSSSDVSSTVSDWNDAMISTLMKANLYTSCGMSSGRARNSKGTHASYNVSVISCERAPIESGA